MSRFGFAVLLAVGVCFTASRAGDPAPDDLPVELFGDTQENFDKGIKPLLTGIASAKDPILYEGLPHQFWETDQLEKEVKEKKTIKFGKFNFYAAPIQPRKEDVNALVAVLPKAFKKYTGIKMCGGYHPDWCVEWRDGEAVYRVFLCFGCHEARVSGPKHELYADLDEAARLKLLKLFSSYQKNRPERRRPKLPPVPGGPLPRPGGR